MTKILLINPPLTKRELFARGSKEVGSILPPLGISYLASVLEKADYNVEIIDGLVEKISMNDIVKKSFNFDIIGITAVTSFVQRSSQTASAIKEQNKDIKIVMGGPHPTALPEYTLNDNSVDFVVIGEGEYSFLDLIKTIERGENPSKVKGIAYKEHGDVKFTQPRQPIMNLDELPFPAWHLLPMKKYKASEARAIKSRTYTMMTSRGCPFSCSFCNKNIFGRRLRTHSPKRVVDEIEHLVEKYKAEEIDFWDDTFTVQKDRVIKICDLIKERNIDIKWSCESRVDCIDSELLKNMRETGCWLIAYGVESGSERMLKSIGKGFTKNQVRKAFEMTHNAKISTRGYFMMGLIGETLEEIWQTIEFAKELKPDIATFTMLSPLPGTLDFERAQKDGEFDKEYWKHGVQTEFNFPDKPIYVPKSMTASQLMKIHKKAYQEFYLRKEFIIKQFFSIKNFTDMKRLFKGMMAILKS